MILVFVKYFTFCNPVWAIMPGIIGNIRDTLGLENASYKFSSWSMVDRSGDPVFPHSVYITPSSPIIISRSAIII